MARLERKSASRLRFASASARQPSFTLARSWSRVNLVSACASTPGANDALTRLANAVVSLTPIGVFCIAASAAGTISPGEFEQLQLYIAAYVVAALFMTFWIIPALVSAVTPLSHRAVISVSKDALVTAFATGSVFVVLPILADRAKTLIADAGGRSEQSDGVIDVVLPASYSFPTAARSWR